jgi:hypothetical protein
MPLDDFPAGDRHAEKPIFFTGNDRSVTSANSRDGARVPWRPVGTAVTSLGAPIGLGMLHPMLGEIIAVIEVVVVLTIIATALFGSQALSERAFRLLRWFGNRPEPPTPGSERRDEVGDTTPPGGWS